MQLAINYSPQAAALVESGVIDVDLYKCPDWDDVVQEASQQRPVYVHFPLHAGSGRMPHTDWSKIETFLNTTATRCVNIHLAPHTGQFPGLELDSVDRAWLEPLAERIIEDITLAKQYFPAEQIILENVPFDSHPQYAIARVATLPDFVTQIVEETGCGFLLDVAHARIAALYLDMAPLDYLDALPVNRIQELHITGTAFSTEENLWIDHTPMSDEDWTFAEYAIQRIAAADWSQPDIVALEYGGVSPAFQWRSKSEVIAREMPRLGELIQTARLHV